MFLFLIQYSAAAMRARISIVLDPAFKRVPAAEETQQGLFLHYCHVLPVVRDVRDFLVGRSRPTLPDKKRSHDDC